MKLIPCTHCGARHIGPKTLEHPNGAPVVFGYWSGGGGKLVVKCHRCTNSMRLAASDFHRLPVLSEDDELALGFKRQLAVR